MFDNLEPEFTDDFLDKLIEQELESKLPNDFKHNKHDIFGDDE